MAGDVHCGPGDIRDGQNCMLGSPRNAEALGPNGLMSFMGNTSQLLPARQPCSPSTPESRAAPWAAAQRLLSGSGPVCWSHPSSMCWIWGGGRIKPSLALLPATDHPPNHRVAHSQLRVQAPAPGTL